jgi:uncharacterized membrane protein
MCMLSYLACIVLLMVVDAPYLYTNSKMYEKKTIAVSGKTFTKRYYSAVIVYLALALGIVFLALPRMRKNSLKNRATDAMLYGGVFGLASYATFDFTMHFMFEDWDLGVSIMDSVWGGVLCSIVAFVVSYI